MIVYEAADLIWATRIKGTADQLSIPCRPVRSLDMLRDRLADSPVSALIVDLEQPELAVDLIRAVREHERASGGRRIYALAFGPHVEKERFQQARDAGVDEVLPRGAFDRALPEILLKLSAMGAEAGQ